jgi:hypothetical protein
MYWLHPSVKVSKSMPLAIGNSLEMRHHDILRFNFWFYIFSCNLVLHGHSHRVLREESPWKTPFGRAKREQDSSSLWWDALKKLRIYTCMCFSVCCRIFKQNHWVKSTYHMTLSSDITHGCRGKTLVGVTTVAFCSGSFKKYVSIWCTFPKHSLSQ